MSVKQSEKTGSGKAPGKRRDRAAEIANTFEWLITAFILAFVFRAFVMEAFRIPTGSMADTLKGAHFRLRCPQCGYRYEYGFSPERYRLPQDTIPRAEVELVRSTHCPSCGYYLSAGTVMPVANGDRILVLKCIYQFFDPKRWDIIVFKNPDDPSENYIKRLIGLPGEKVEIIDGDVYIHGRIRRKPFKVQDELWMPVYDNDYQPVRPREGSFNGHLWQQPFRNDPDSGWIVGDKENPTLFQLDSPSDQIDWLSYDTSLGNDFTVTYAYNDAEINTYNTYCSDLMVRLFVRSAAPEGRIGIALSKYETVYRAWVDFKGEMIIEKTEKDKGAVELKRKSVSALGGPAIRNPTLVKFVNVDHQLIFEFGREKLVYDLGQSPEAAGPREIDIEPQVKIFGAGKLTLSHVAIFRDIHYTRYRLGDNHQPGRATEGNAYLLGEDEFLVLGDNSPNSEDSRWWARKGIGTNGQLVYREGVVPRDYLVGKALFVYWPSGFEFPWPGSLKRFLLNGSYRNFPMRIIYAVVSLRWIPNVGQMRFIYGGSSGKSHLANNEPHFEQ